MHDPYRYAETTWPGESYGQVPPDKLNAVMEFEHVVYIDGDGNVRDLTSEERDKREAWAPTVYDDRVDGDGWALLNGYSGQYGYGGPTMHPSEFIGGQLARDILAGPGYYVAVFSYALPDEEDPSDDPDDDDEDDEDDVAGWCVAYRSSL